MVLNAEAAAERTSRPSWRSRLVRYGPLVLWIALIFFFSSGEASAEQTSRIIGPLLHFFFPSASPETLQQYHFFIRKCAHLTEYAVLAFWAIRAWTTSSYEAVRKYRFLLAAILVFAVASFDEIIQSFEPSRTSTPWDVVLDAIGGTAMAAALKMIDIIRRRRSPGLDGPKV